MARTLVTICLGLILSGTSSCTIATIWAMGREQVSVKERIEVKGYNVKLERRLGWAGPPYYRYVLQDGSYGAF